MPSRPSVLCYTHTSWEEAPRIRHQAARLLRDRGYDILFVERASGHPLGVTEQPRQVEGGIWVARPRRFLHHQLRVLPIQHRVHAWHASLQLRRIICRWEGAPFQSVLNFAHDGWFLREIFPDAFIRTVIHDDFEAQSRLPISVHIAWDLRRTCLASDGVFAVSEALVDRLGAWCNARLLLPWATEPYVAPIRGPEVRDCLLFWGYVDMALDLDVIRGASAALATRFPGGRILLTGPTQTRGARTRIQRSLASCTNVEIREPCGLDELPLQRVLAALLPYRRSKAVDGVTLANKSMRLLSRGLPLLISGMPRYLTRDFITRIDGAGGPSAALDRCIDGFWEWQPAIRQFCLGNDSDTAFRSLGFKSPLAFDQKC
jgi:hypothetical protein